MLRLKTFPRNWKTVFPLKCASIKPSITPRLEDWKALITLRNVNTYRGLYRPAFERHVESRADEKLKGLERGLLREESLMQSLAINWQWDSICANHVSHYDVRAAADSAQNFVFSDSQQSFVSFFPLKFIIVCAYITQRQPQYLPIFIIFHSDFHQKRLALYTSVFHHLLWGVGKMFFLRFRFCVLRCLFRSPSLSFRLHSTVVERKWKVVVFVWMGKNGDKSDRYGEQT